MTTGQFLALSPRERDELVAEKVMENNGAIVCNQHGHLLSQNRPKEPCSQILGKWEFKGTCLACGWVGEIALPLFRYSTDIAAAWEIIVKLEEDGWKWSMHGLKNHCDFKLEKWNEDEQYYDSGYACEENKSLAICISALKAVGAISD